MLFKIKVTGTIKTLDYNDKEITVKINGFIKRKYSDQYNDVRDIIGTKKKSLVYKTIKYSKIARNIYKKTYNNDNLTFTITPIK